jgi:2-oxoglutarate/2-oxoacid ferredoxin oxidoreductase subunit alpha
VDNIEVPDLAVEDPTGRARVLVLGWGSTYGPIGAACRALRKRGQRIAQAHLRYLNPFPANLGEVLRRYDRVIVPEMNLGQLSTLLRARFLVDAVSYTKVAGTPFMESELVDVFSGYLGTTLAEAA